MWGEKQAGGREGGRGAANRLKLDVCEHGPCAVTSAHPAHCMRTGIPQHAHMCTSTSTAFQGKQVSPGRRGLKVQAASMRRTSPVPACT